MFMIVLVFWSDIYIYIYRSKQTHKCRFHKNMTSLLRYLLSISKLVIEMMTNLLRHLLLKFLCTARRLESSRPNVGHRRRHRLLVQRQSGAM